MELDFYHDYLGRHWASVLNRYKSPIKHSLACDTCESIRVRLYWLCLSFGK